VLENGRAASETSSPCRNIEGNVKSVGIVHWLKHGCWRRNWAAGEPPPPGTRMRGSFPLELRRQGLEFGFQHQTCETFWVLWTYLDLIDDYCNKSCLDLMWPNWYLRDKTPDAAIRRSHKIWALPLKLQHPSAGITARPIPCRLDLTTRATRRQ
jgi:hypothetical protein